MEYFSERARAYSHKICAKEKKLKDIYHKFKAEKALIERYAYDA